MKIGQVVCEVCPCIIRVISSAELRRHLSGRIAVERGWHHTHGEDTRGKPSISTVCGSTSVCAEKSKLNKCNACCEYGCCDARSTASSCLSGIASHRHLRAKLLPDILVTNPEALDKCPPKEHSCSRLHKRVCASMTAAAILVLLLMKSIRATLNLSGQD